MISEVVLQDGDVVLLAGLYNPSPTGKGNPWHNPHTGEFTFGPPGVRILRGIAHMRTMPSSSKWSIESRRKRFGVAVDAMTADRIGNAVRINLFVGAKHVDSFDVPGTEKPLREAKKGKRAAEKGIQETDPRRVEYERIIKDLRNYGMYMQAGERHSDSPGTRHLNQDERGRLFSLRRELDDLVVSGVFRAKPRDALEAIEISRARDRRKHFNPAEREKLKEWRRGRISDDIGKNVHKLTGIAKKIGSRPEFEREDFDKHTPYVEPPPPRGVNRGKGGVVQYSADRSFSSKTKLGEEGEKIFAYYTGGELLHPGRPHGDFDVRADGYLFEVKSNAADATEYKASPKPHEIEAKLKEAKRLGLDPALAMVIVDTRTGRTHIYWRPGLKGGKLTPNRGWRYLGETDHRNIPGVDIPDPNRYAEDAFPIHHDEKGPYTLDPATGYKVYQLPPDRRLGEGATKRRQGKMQQGYRRAGQKPARSVTKPHQHHHVIPKGTQDQPAEDVHVPQDLNGAERVAMLEYISGMGSWVNGVLRGGVDENSLNYVQRESYHSIVGGIDSAIAKQAPLDKGMIVWRSDDKFYDAKVGEVIHDAGFPSTTAQEGGVRRFGDVVVEIRVPEGTRVMDLTRLDDPYVRSKAHEHEVLLPRGGDFRIVSAGKGDTHEHFGKRRKLVAEFIPPEGSVEQRLIPTKVTARMGVYKGQTVTIIGNRADGKAVYIEVNGQRKMVSPNSVTVESGGKTAIKETAKPKAPSNKGNIRTTIKDDYAVETLQFPKRKLAEIREAIDSIEGVHRMPLQLRELTFLKNNTMNAWGRFTPVGGNGSEIEINASFNEPVHLTVAHEIGHYIDWLLGGKVSNQFRDDQGYYGINATYLTKISNSADKGLIDPPSKTYTKEIKSLLRVIKGSHAHKKLKEEHKLLDALLDQLRASDSPNVQAIEQVEKEIGSLEYNLRDIELFARAYSQWIAHKSRNQGMLDELATRKDFDESFWPRYRQWDDEDFGTIYLAMERLFNKEGLL